MGCDPVTIVAQLLWEIHKQSLPGKGVGVEPPWGDTESGQTYDFYKRAEEIVGRNFVANDDYKEQPDEEFLWFVENTLIPDLTQSGMSETAADFERCLVIIRSEERWLALGYQEFPS